MAVGLVGLAAFVGCSAMTDEDEEEVETSASEDELVADNAVEVRDLGNDASRVAPGAAVRYHGRTVVVPGRGRGVELTVDALDGTGGTFRVETDLDGRVHMTAHDDAAEATATSCGSPGPCNDDAHAAVGAKWTQTYAWAFKAGSTPSANNVDNVEQRLKDAVGNITHSRNNCSLADYVSATSSYKGRTTRSPNIPSNTSSYSCGSYDGHNVVGFGSLPPGVLAVTCTWTYPGVIAEADVKINKANTKWFATNTKPSGCWNKFSVEGVMTHEFGHAFGLGHVGECHHGKLTMSTAIAPCDTSSNTLGLGDVKALRSVY